MSHSDYIYLDMQTTNVNINTDYFTPGTLSFNSTLNTTIVPNDYYVSVDKFQVDTSGLPVLVVEPDIVSTPFVPNKTIHKVGIMTSEANLLISEYVNYQRKISNITYGPPPVETSPSDISASIDGSIIAVGYEYESTNGNGNAGKVILYNSDRTPTVIQSPYQIDGERFGRSLSVSGNGRFIAIGTSGESEVIYIYDVVNNTIGVLNKPFFSNAKVKFNNLGNKMAVLYTDNNTGFVYEKYEGMWSPNFEFSIQMTNDTPFAFNRVGDAIVIGVPNYGYCVYYYYHYDNGDWYNIFSAGDHYSFGTRLDMKGPDNIILVSAPLEDTHGRIYEFIPDPPNEQLTFIYKHERTASNMEQIGNGQLNMTEDSLHFYMTILMSGGYLQIWRFDRINHGHLENITNPITSSVKVAIYGKYTDFGSFACVRADKYGDVNTVRERNISNLTHSNLPENVKNVPSITNVIWEQQDISPPSLTSLNGKNTIQFPYYHCNSYSKFINLVNKAIANAYIENYNYLFDNWIYNVEERIKKQFIDIALRSFPIPPFLEWDTTKSIAKLYVNQFFNGSSYLLPARDWVPNAPILEATTNMLKEYIIPFKLKLVFNASLYSLFNNFPATPIIINNEQFYILELNSKSENINMPLINYFPLEKYTFFESYTVKGTTTIPYLPFFEYPGSTYYFTLEQEVPTIEAWNPIYSLALVIPQDITVQNQLKTLSLSGYDSDDELESTIKNEKADFIIKIDGRYRPTFIYNKQFGNSNVNLVGKTPITTLQTNVYYISKTGILLPFKLPKSGSASLRLLFEKRKK